MHRPLIWSPLPQKEIPGEMCSQAIPIYHQLCVAYCLRALCTQEAEPCSEVLKHADTFHFVIRLFLIFFLGKWVVTEDFTILQVFLEFWSFFNSHNSIIILLLIKHFWLCIKQQIFEDVKAALGLWLDISSLDCFEEGGCSALPDSIMILLYNIIDLLHLKVCFSS